MIKAAKLQRRLDCHLQPVRQGPETWDGDIWVSTLKNIDSSASPDPSGQAEAACSFLLKANPPLLHPWLEDSAEASAFADPTSPLRVRPFLLPGHQPDNQGEVVTESGQKRAGPAKGRKGFYPKEMWT